MRVLVCGSRTYGAEGPELDAMTSLLWGLAESDTVVHGGAKGADTTAGLIAMDWGCPVEVFRAEWDKHGKAAGFIRNQQMLDSGVSLVMAFVNKPLVDSKGTAHMVSLARKAGVRTIVVEVY